MTGISAGLHVRRSDDVTLRAASRARRVCLPARQPRRRRSSWEISKRRWWSMKRGVALRRNVNNGHVNTP